MKQEIKTKYLVFPVNTLCSEKTLSFKLDGKVVYSLNIRLDNESPDFFAYIDLGRFMGESLEICVSPEMPLEFRQTEEMAPSSAYAEAERPQIHFTAKNGWINDPNGLIYKDGVYHMFFQHNPAEMRWGNMHWGHAVSTDLLHWEQKDIALFPDERGMMFSGSAIEDKKGVLGIDSKDGTALALFYTTTSPFCQHISYSTDGFKTVKRYTEEPAVAHITGNNRDPKVVFCDELSCYIMALFLIGDEYCLLRSDDLANWEMLQRISIEGDNECPDLFPLDDGQGGRKWVLMGAHDKYLVGEFKDGRFLPLQGVRSLHYGNSAYAGQSFSNLPNGRVIRLEWDSWKLPDNAFSFNGQMGIPVEMSLEKIGDEYLLASYPIKEFDSLCKNVATRKGLCLSPHAEEKIALDFCAHRVRIRIKKGELGKLSLSIFGVKAELDLDEELITVGQFKAPLSFGGDREVTLISDRCSLEVFADKGKSFISRLDLGSFCDPNLRYLSLVSTKETLIESLEVDSVSPIW